MQWLFLGIVKTIPIHNLENQHRLPKFEVLPWKKTVSKYDASLPHRHNYYEVLVFFKGGGKHEIDFCNYEIISHSLHFVCPNQVHVVRRQTGSDGLSLLFAAEFLDTNFKLPELDFYRNNNTPVLNLAESDFEPFKQLIEEIKAEFISDNKRKREVLQSLLQVFLIKVQRAYEQQHVAAPIVSVRSNAATHLAELIEKNYTQHWRAGDYARELGLGIIQLNNICKQHFSKSTEALIQERVVLEIKRALVYSDKAIKEICYDLKFEDPAYFIRFFKKHTGVTPSEYRKSVNE